MKKAAILAAALAMVLTFAACGNRDNNDPDDRSDGNTVTDNNGVNGSNDRTDPITGNSSTNGNSSSTSRDPVTGSSGSSLTDDNDIIDQDDRDDRDGLDNADNSSMGRSRVGNDLRRAADGVGDAMTGLADAGRDAITGKRPLVTERTRRPGERPRPPRSFYSVQSMISLHGSPGWRGIWIYRSYFS